MNNELNRTTLMCKRLKLGEGFQEAAEMKKCKERDFLVSLLEGEIERRDLLNIQKNLKNAHFPEQKTLETFDFSDVELPKEVAKPYFTECRFVKDKYNLFFYGQPGTGKTHLAISLGIEACKNQEKVLFFRLSELAEHLRNIKTDKRFRNNISKASLIIIDEFGYPPADDDFLPNFFDFVCNYCYEKKSLIMTSNRTFSEWLADFEGTRFEKMADATIDRIIQYAFLFTFSGESKRRKQMNIRQLQGL